MLILDKPRVFDGEIVKVPLYHRGHLSLFPGAKVWMCLLPGGLGTGVFPELVISPIHFDSWPDLWRIRVTLFERPGLLRDIYEVLRQQSINILAAESSSMEWQKLHSIEVTVDARRYGSQDDGSHEDRSTGKVNDLIALRREILTSMIDDISFDVMEKPRISIRRIMNLFEAHRAFDKSQTDVRSGGLAPVIGNEPIIRRKGTRSVYIKLPIDIRSSLHQSLLGEVRKRPTVYGKYLIVSETTGRFLRSIFLKEDEPFLSPTLLHKEEVGALASITAAIESAGFNIITSLSRLYEYGTEAQSEFVLQPVDKNNGKMDEGALRARLEKALSTYDLVDTYHVRVAYTVGYTGVPEAKPLVTPRGKYGAARRVLKESVESRLSRWQQVYHRRFHQSGEDILARMRFTLVSSLFSEIDPFGAKRRLPLFVSYSFKDDERFKRIEKSARGMGFQVITGKQLGAASSNRDGIRRLMQQCTHFLGVWSEDGGIQVKHGENALWWPSPWLHWELGVAESLNLRWRLLISEAIEPMAWQKLVSTTPHDMFSKTNFDKKFRDALRNLRTVT